MKRKRFVIWRRVLLAVIGMVLGVNIYQWNASSIVGNEMPMPFGTGVSVVLSGSMEPTLSVNDVVMVREAEKYEVDDIVVFQSGSELIIHRIIEINGETVLTKGDANGIADAPIDISTIKGKMIFAIPMVGMLVKFFKTLPGTIILLVIAIVLMEMSWKKEKDRDEDELEAIKREIRMLRNEQIEKEGGDSDYE